MSGYNTLKMCLIQEWCYWHHKIFSPHCTRRQKKFPKLALLPLFPSSFSLLLLPPSSLSNPPPSSLISRPPPVAGGEGAPACSQQWKPRLAGRSPSPSSSLPFSSPVLFSLSLLPSPSLPCCSLYSSSPSPSVMEYMHKYYYSWTIVTYNVLIDAFGRAGDLKQMEYLFRLMKSERIKPNCVTFCSLVRAYGRAEAVENIKVVLRIIENSDVMLDTMFFNCLVDAYGRVGCLVEMREVLEMMERRGCKPDKITYSTMIKAYARRGISSGVKELQDMSRGEDNTS